MTQPKIRVGIVGNPEKGWAASAHLPALRASEDYEIRAVCTTRIESAREAARDVGAAHALVDAAAMAAHPEVDLVAVVVKVPAHRTAVLAAIGAGKDVFCEWPLGTRTGEAAEMAEAGAGPGSGTGSAFKAGRHRLCGTPGTSSPKGTSAGCRRPRRQGLGRGPRAGTDDLDRRRRPFARRALLLSGRVSRALGDPGDALPRADGD